MKKSDDKHSDKDLKAYLDGTDGVSAAYRKTARDEPSAALDRAILDAARREVVSKELEIGGRQMPHMYGTAALAASVMVGILATSLYFNPQQVVVPVSVPASAESVVLDEPRAERLEQQRNADQAGVPDTRAFQVRQIAPAAPAVGVANAPAAPAPAVANDVRTDAFARLAEAPPVVIEGPLLERIEADAAQAQQSETAELEEVTVTASRVLRGDDRDYSYRDSREDWLEQIRTQVEELEALGRLTGNTVFQEQQLQEEMDLFMEEYPDADLDAELAE